MIEKLWELVDSHKIAKSILTDFNKVMAGDLTKQKVFVRRSKRDKTGRSVFGSLYK